MQSLKERLTEAEIAYLAGLFDGEGCVGYYKRIGNRNKYSYISVVMITQSDARLMKWIKDKIGFGTIYSRAGKKHIEYHWETNRKELVYDFLKTINPYLVLKGEQVELLLEHLDHEGLEPMAKGEVTSDVIQRREYICDKMKELKVCNLVSIH